jgi:hypothetical protein
VPKKQKNLHLTVARIVLVVFAISFFFIIFRIINAPSVAIGSPSDIETKNDYIVTLVKCVLGILALALPFFIHRRMSLQLPDSFLITYFIFLFCTIYLGEIQSFYALIPHWDTVLHILSGVMLGSLGLSVLLSLNNSAKSLVHLSPLFIAIFAFCFAVTLGTIWEVYEYLVDGIIGSNMQSWKTFDGEILSGHIALSDTMKDLIVDMLGALIMSSIGLTMMNKKPEWIHQFDVRTSVGENK